MITSDQVYRHVRGVNWSLRQYSSITSLNQSFGYLKPEFHMCESSTCCHFAVGKISIHKKGIDKVEKFASTTFWVVVEAVVCYQLI